MRGRLKKIGKKFRKIKKKEKKLQGKERRGGRTLVTLRLKVGFGLCFIEKD